MKKKTHEEYVEELKIKNPTVEVIGKYVDAKTKIEHHCLKHDVYWEVAPTQILTGTGCEMCRKDKFKKIRSRSSVEYEQSIRLIHPNLLVLEPYINARTKIMHKCIVHNIEWSAFPDNVLRGHGCPICGNEKNAVRRSKTHKEYVEQLNLKNKNIIVLEKYINSKTPILHKCLIDDYEWYASPGNILYGTGCPKCGNNLKRTHDEYVKKVSIISPHIRVIDDYINARTPILHKCLHHDIQWKVSPSSILMGCGCPKCGTEKLSLLRRKSHAQYQKELKLINPNITVIGTYINNNTKILHQCLIDGYKWYATPGNILSGHGCPKCNESKMEKEAALWLDHNSIPYIRYMKFDGCSDKKQLSYDFYLPDYNTNIECQGLQHYEPVDYFGGEEAFKIQQKHDAIKRQYCLDNHIELLEIPYWENVENTLNNFLFN